MFNRKEAARKEKLPAPNGVSASAEAVKVPVPNGQALPSRRLDGNSSDGVVLIGRNTHIVGEISDCSLVEIEGGLQGNLVADKLIVHEGGSAQGNLHAAQAEVHGYVDGDVSVQGLLDVRSTGQITGKLTYGRLAVADGGFVQGNLHTQAANSEPQQGQTAHQSGLTLDQPFADQGVRAESMVANGHAVELDPKRSETAASKVFSLEAAAQRHQQ